MFKGIDVSYAQGKIDWQKVKGAGIQFAMIRSSYGKNASQVDARLRENVAGCAAVGIPYGFYHYGYADTPERARQEAKFFLETVSGYDPCYPLAYDVEDASLAGLSKTALTDASLAFLDEVEKAGYCPMLYASLSWLTSKLDAKRIIDCGYDIWLAQWSSKPTFSGEYGMWQSTDSGRVDGINAAVDLNTAYKDYPALIKGGNELDNTPDSYAADAIAWAVANGILLGDEKGDYKLRENITRQDALVVLYRAFR